MVNLKNKMKNTITQEDVEMLKIIAHPVRLQIIIELIRLKRCNVKQLTEILAVPQSTVSQHLSKMRGKILHAERKGLEIYYSITNLKAYEIVGFLGIKIGYGNVDSQF
ncbi:transcriptional regulator (plasmid) [Bacillus sp. JAS24-2]|uniref:ArsR/SmtB family transcription factor n=1 Tax=Bacillus sp. JAS24-2 TaxID=2217832 RepID=UPI0011EEF2C8|nr:metalloregulator ArsR/SmtB family transcription factor [Bacillus sp. JAS24-2]QEL82889.1 transcriptional regulator [Bacillus sp. JAS24-2]